jgi:protein phosphatase
MQITPASAEAKRTDTQPLTASSTFTPRPAGSIFGDVFLYRNLLFSEEQQHRYLVAQMDVPDKQQIRVCPNVNCGAIFPPRDNAAEKYCTDCGSVIKNLLQDLALTETRAVMPDNLIRTIGKSLSHSGVRAPVMAFVERLAGTPRYCMAAPYVEPLAVSPDTIQGLKWGVSLARGLDYLHDNGVTFNGKVDETIFGLDGNRLVWANFSNCSHRPDGTVNDRQPDVRALAAFLYQWLTGKTQFERDPRIKPGLSQVFEQALSAPGFTTGWELAYAFEQALQDLIDAQAVDYEFGRRTHVGMIRDLNEDSLLTLELNRTQQSISQPIGVFVVADGMGGHAAGELASGTIVNTIAQKALAELMPAQAEKPDCGDWLRQAVEAANREVFSLRKSKGTDMGSTLVSAVLEGNRAYIAHVGDSRAYLIQASGIQQITIDHSLVERLVATHQITRQEARHHPQRNVIYRTVGDKSEIEVDISVRKLAVGDQLLLCSDGLSGMVDDEAIRDIVLQSTSPQAACEALINAANAAGGEDNVTAILIKITQR